MYESELDMGGVGSFINCTKMDAQKVCLLALTRGLTGAVCFLICVVSMLLVVSRRCLAALRESMQARLMAYLLLSTAAYRVEHYWNYDGSGNDTAQRHSWQVKNVCMYIYTVFNEEVHVYTVFNEEVHVSTYLLYTQVDLCEAIGMADQYTGTVQLFFTVGVAVYFVYHSLKFFCKKSNMNLGILGAKKVRTVLEVLFVVASVLAPAVYAWMPFTAVPYGETGPWCWIRTLERSCDKLKGAFWEQMGIWYIPFGIAAFFSFVAITLFLVGLCCCWPKIKKLKRQKKGEACVLIAFLCTYCLLFMIELVSFSISTKVHTDYFAVWLVYALSTPLSGVTLPIGLLIYTHTGTLREKVVHCCTCHCIQHQESFFRNTSSFTHVPSSMRASDYVQLGHGADLETVQNSHE